MAGSNAQGGNVTASDLNESERLALVAFEKTLNKRLPEILPETSGMTVAEDGDPSNKALEYLLKEYVLNDKQIAANPDLKELKTLYAALPDNAKPIALPEQAVEQAIAKFSGDDRRLAEFKQILNQQLPNIIPETKDMVLNIDANPLDGAMIYLLDNYVLNEDMIKQNPKLSDLKALYEGLPDTIRAQTETYEMLVVKPSDAEGVKKQSQAVVNQAQLYLGTNDAQLDSDIDRVNIGEKTSRALRDRIEALQKSGEIGADIEPREFDQRVVDSLDQLVKSRMEDAGISSQSELNLMLVNLWVFDNGGAGLPPPSQEERSLGEAVSLRNIMNFIVNSELPSGAKALTPKTDVTWDSQWINNDSGDRFFNNDTYRELYGSRTVSTDTLFDKSGYSEENYAILMQATENLGIDMHSGRTMSELEVGKIATEILSLKAQEAWCFISPGTEFDEKKIHEMIHSGQFMPHIDDLALAEKGVGLPETEFFRRKVEEYGPNESWRLEFEERTAVLAYRAQRFAERFGEIPQYAVEEKAARYHESEDHIRHSYGTPSLYFGSVRSLFGSTKQTKYEHDRDIYLERYQKFKEDIGTCNPVPEPVKEPCADNNECSVEGVLLRGEDFSKVTKPDKTIDDCIKSNAQDATGNDQGECTVESEIDNRMNNDAAVKLK